MTTQDGTAQSKKSVKAETELVDSTKYKFQLKNVQMEPVCPYANIQALYPSSAQFTTSVPISL